MQKKTYRSEYVKCGKSACKSCPHGPYWYAYWHRGGRMYKEYIGKTMPRFERPGRGREEPPQSHDDIHNRQTANPKLAYDILGLPTSCTEQQAKTKARELLRDNHPDRGGDNRRFCQINSAWTYLKWFKGWK